jgi:hypothetical protein
MRRNVAGKLAPAITAALPLCLTASYPAFADNTKPQTATVKPNQAPRHNNRTGLASGKGLLTHSFNQGVQSPKNLNAGAAGKTPVKGKQAQPLQSTASSFASRSV